MKTKIRKPRRMWAISYPGVFRVIETKDKLKMRSKHDCIPDYIPVLVIDLSKESVEAMVEQMAKAIFDAPQGQAKGSVEEAGYEFTNGHTEAYRQLWWKILKARMARLLADQGNEGGKK